VIEVEANVATSDEVMAAANARHMSWGIVANDYPSPAAINTLGSIGSQMESHCGYHLEFLECSPLCFGDL
jgi:hypothetical protein